MQMTSENALSENRPEIKMAARKMNGSRRDKILLPNNDELKIIDG